MLTRLDHELILLFYEKGYTQSIIARKLNVSRNRINQILTGYRTLGNKERQYFQKKLSKKCNFCEKKREHIHHIDHDSKNNTLDNLMPLCRSHHSQIHRGTRIKRIIDIAQKKRELKRRPIRNCAYPNCRREFFPWTGREDQQRYCKPTHQKNDWKKRKKELVSVG